MNDKDLKQFEEILTVDVPDINNAVSQCKYYSFSSDKLDISNHFSIIHINARSMKNKFDEIQNLLTASGVDWSVVCISETWLKENQVSSFILDRFNVFASCRRDGEGGGSLLYVSKIYEVKERKELESKEIETTFVEIYLTNLKKSVIVGNIYKPPSYQHKPFHDYMELTLDILEAEKKIVVLSGDFNYNLLAQQDKHSLNFSNLLSSYGFLPVIYIYPHVFKTIQSHF